MNLPTKPLHAVIVVVTRFNETFIESHDEFLSHLSGVYSATYRIHLIQFIATKLDFQSRFLIRDNAAFWFFPSL